MSFKNAIAGLPLGGGKSVILGGPGTTKYVAGRAGISGDPSPHTVRGVFRAMQAGALVRWGSDQLAGKTVALQGCGNVGYHLARELAHAGATLIVEVEKLTLPATLTRIDAIYDTTLKVLAHAASEAIPPSEAADRLAEAKIRSPRP